MLPNIKNQLIARINELENSRPSGNVSHQEFEKDIYNIILPLFEHDGYSLEYKHGIGDGGIDFVAVHGEASSNIAIQYKHRHHRLRLADVREMIGAAVTSSYNRMFLLTNSSFGNDCYALIDKVNPVKLELLTLQDIKTWISRITEESDINKLDYENIIRVVSRTFIGQIARDPNFLMNIEWRELEKTIAELFEGLAFRVQLTPVSKDGGKDIILECTMDGDKKTFIVEVKHWRSLQRVGQDSVKDFLKVIVHEKRTSGLFLSTYGFTDTAFEGLTELERKKIKFGNQNKIVSLCNTYLKVRSGIWTPLNNLQDLLFEECCD
jgi:restriction system protein